MPRNGRTVYSMRGESDEIYESDTAAVIRNVAYNHVITEEEARKLIFASTGDNPVKYNDEIFWMND